jgi:hypothetical protein
MPRTQKLQNFSIVLIISLLYSTALSAPIASTFPLTTLFASRKAGLAGWPGIQNQAAFKQFAAYLSHYIDYTPNTPNYGKVKGVGMLKAAGNSPCIPAGSIATFESMSTPDVMLGFNEPDCPCDAGSQMSVSSATSSWNQYLAPLKKKGTILGSPAPCKQIAETFLAPFEAGLSVPWDVTTFHVYQNTLAEVEQVVNHYVSKYKKPVWITEIACVDAVNWTPCASQTEVNDFIASVVKYFESNANVVAYSFIQNGAGLGKVWPLATESGEITESGRAYLEAIK